MEREAKRYLVHRDGMADLSFHGWRLAADTDGWPEVRLYRSESGRYILDIRDLDERGEVTNEVQILEDLDSVVTFINEKYGVFSSTAKTLFRLAGSSEPSLLKYAIEEV